MCFVLFLPVSAADLPATEEEFRAAVEWPGDEPLPGDVAAYYAAAANPAIMTPMLTASAESGKKYGGSGKTDAHHNYYVRYDGWGLYRDRWCVVPQMTPEQLDQYWDWYMSLDYQTQLWIMTDYDGCDEATKKQIQEYIVANFVPKPEKLDYDDSASVWWSARADYIDHTPYAPTEWFPEHGTVYGQRPGGIEQMLVGRHTYDIETAAAAARIASGSIYHPWTDQDDPDLVRAAATDFGTFDGEQLGYMLGFRQLKRLYLHPNAFDAVAFPSSVYAQAYYDAFREGLEIGYNDGAKDYQDQYFLKLLEIQQTAQIAHKIDAGRGLAQALLQGLLLVALA